MLFSCIISFEFYSSYVKLCKGSVAVTTTTLQIRKLRVREIKWFAAGYYTSTYLEVKLLPFYVLSLEPTTFQNQLEETYTGYSCLLVIVRIKLPINPFLLEHAINMHS